MQWELRAHSDGFLDECCNTMPVNYLESVRTWKLGVKWKRSVTPLLLTLSAMEEEKANHETATVERDNSENQCCFPQLLSGQKSNLSLKALENVSREENSSFNEGLFLRESMNSMLEENVNMRITIDQVRHSAMCANSSKVPYRTNLPL